MPGYPFLEAISQFAPLSQISRAALGTVAKRLLLPQRFDELHFATDLDRYRNLMTLNPTRTIRDDGCRTPGTTTYSIYWRIRTDWHGRFIKALVYADYACSNPSSRLKVWD